MRVPDSPGGSVFSTSLVRGAAAGNTTPTGASGASRLRGGPPAPGTGPRYGVPGGLLGRESASSLQPFDFLLAYNNGTLCDALRVLPPEKRVRDGGPAQPGRGSLRGCQSTLQSTLGIFAGKGFDRCETASGAQSGVRRGSATRVPVRQSETGDPEGADGKEGAAHPPKGVGRRKSVDLSPRHPACRASRALQ